MVTFTSLGKRGGGSLAVGGTMSFIGNTLFTGQQEREGWTQERGIYMSAVAKTMESESGST